MNNGKEKIPGTLVSEIKQMDGSIVQTYEVEILGVKCRYLHLKEAPRKPYCSFTRNEIFLN